MQAILDQHQHSSQAEDMAHCDWAVAALWCIDGNTAETPCVADSPNRDSCSLVTAWGIFSSVVLVLLILLCLMSLQLSCREPEDGRNIRGMGGCVSD